MVLANLESRSNLLAVTSKYTYKLSMIHLKCVNIYERALEKKLRWYYELVEHTKMPNNYKH